jgi:hypothetical protein
MDAREETLSLLRKSGAELLRSKKHNIYRLKDGSRYVTPATPSDVHAWRNCLSFLKVKLGLSLRGEDARVGSPKEKRKARQRQPRQPSALSPSPIGFNFRDKIRAALKGERLVSLPHDATVSVSAPKPNAATLKGNHGSGLPKGRREPSERHGAVRQWSKAEIEAANAAMRQGKLNQYMSEYYRASTPFQPKENQSMLSVEQMQQTIAELESGMLQAIEEQQNEHAVILRLEGEIVMARERLQAAVDRHNSLNSVRDSLAVCRDDLEKVRPMLGLLAKQPATATPISQGPRMKLKDAMKIALEKAERPLTARQLHETLNRMGCPFTMASIYTLVSIEKKKNGNAFVNSLDGAYWLAGRPVPEAAIAH